MKLSKDSQKTIANDEKEARQYEDNCRAFFGVLEEIAKVLNRDKDKPKTNQ